MKRCGEAVLKAFLRCPAGQALYSVTCLLWGTRSWNIGGHAGRPLILQLTCNLQFPCPSTSLKITQHTCDRVSPMSGMFSWHLLLVELPKQLGNVESLQASDRREARWPLAGHFTSPRPQLLYLPGGDMPPSSFAGCNCSCKTWKRLPSKCSSYSIRLRVTG